MFVGRSTTSFSTATLAALLCCTFLIVINIEHATCMSLDRLAIDRNEIETEKQTEQEQEDYSANSNIIVDDMELEAVPASAAGVAGDTELYLLLPAGIDQNTIEENAPIDAANEDDSSSNLVENGGDMLMMETIDTPAAMQAVLMPVEAEVASASEMESEATEVEAEKIDEPMLSAQEVEVDATTPAISLMSDEMMSEQEAVQKDDEQLPTELPDKVEEIAVDTEMASSSNQEATNQETIIDSEAQVEQAEAENGTNEVDVEKSDADSELVADIIAEAVDTAEKQIDSEPTVDEELKTEADNNVETNNDNKQEVPTIEIVENEEVAEMLSEDEAEKQNADVESATEAIKETKSDIESLTAAIDAMLPEQTVDSELETEAQTNQETVQNEKLEELAETSEAELVPEETQAESEMETIREETMPEDKLVALSQTDIAQEQTEAAEDTNLQAAEDNEEKTEVQANPQTDVEQTAEELIIETVAPQEAAQEDIQIVADKQEENETTEEKHDEIMQTEDVNKDEILSEVTSEEVSKVETDNIEKVEAVSNTQDHEQQEVETVNQEIETQNTPVEEAELAENNESESAPVVQGEPQLVEQPQEIQQTVTQEVSKQESEVQPEIIVSNDEVQPEVIGSADEVQPEIIVNNDEAQPEIIVSNDDVQPEIIVSNDEVQPEIIMSNDEVQPEINVSNDEVQPEINVSNDVEDEIKQDKIKASENIEETPIKVEEIVNIETEIKPEPITEDKPDDFLKAETAQPETLISASDTEVQQLIEDVMTENIFSSAVNTDEPQTDAAVDSAPITEDKPQITLMDDTVAAAIEEPTQEITKEEMQKTDESQSTATNEEVHPIIDTAVSQSIISAQEENAEESQKPEETASTSILTTIIQVPQELQMQTQDAAEESTPTKVENEAAAATVIVSAPQEIPQEAAPVAAVVVESTTQKPLIVADSVLNYVNASLMQQNNNKPIQDDELFNSKLRRYDGAQVWRIVVQNDKDKKLADELQTKYDGQLWKEVKQEVDYLLKPQILAEAEKHIRAANLSRIVLIDNLQKVIEVENPPADQIALLQNRKGHRLTWQAYHRLDDIHGFFDYLAKTYPDICAVETIGYSVQKRPLKILKISNGNTGNPGIWLDGGMHAREWISPASVTYIANQIVEGWDDLPAYMKNVNWYIHAVANPDGYEYSHTTDRLWRKNMRAHGRQCPGVDLNRNFGYKWGGKGTSANPCSQTYRGSKAFSEPETFYISKFISNFPRETFQAYLSFHSYGQYILYPWGYDYHLTKDRSDLDRVARQAGTIITRGSGVKYTVGSSATTLYPAAGGSDDWAKGIAGIKYAYTIELGDTGRYGFVLPASFIEYNGKDSFTFVETVARAVTQGKESRKRAF